MTPFPCASGRRFDFSASFLLFVPCVLRRGLIQFPTPSLSHSLPPHNTRFFSFLSSHTRILFIPPHLAPAYCLFLRTSHPHKKISFCRFFIKKNLTGLFFTAILPPVFWVCSSAGEHYLHTVGAAGSIPATPTNKKGRFNRLFLLVLDVPD